MFSRATKLRFRRRIRMRKLQVEELGEATERHLEHNFYRRLSNLIAVRRFVSVWLIVLVLLSVAVVAQLRGLGAFYLQQQPAPGGTYHEGIVGAFSNANPIYANTPANQTVSKLLFAGLFTFDQNNVLVGDLAEKIVVDASGKIYTVTLKPNLKWHDGQPLTADDVVFTYTAIQNPDARSPFGASWRGIVVHADNKNTVVFTLPNQLASFPSALTNGIVPKHILGDIPVEDLRTVPFNTTNPVGAGPFKFSALEVQGRSPETREEHIGMEPFDGYNGGRPQLDHFAVYTFRNEGQMIKSFRAQQITAMAGLTTMPKAVRNDSSVRQLNFPLTAGAYVFFRTSQDLFSDVVVRQALAQATNRPDLIKQLGYNAEPVKSPLLPGQLGYNPLYLQPEYDLQAAKAQLDAKGWFADKNGYRSKEGKKLQFTLAVQNNDEYRTVARTLQRQWREVGAKVELNFHDNNDFQTLLSSHEYDALLYGISIGQDPDVFVYWNSKNAPANAENRLNFSEYKSATADAALEGGRTRSDPAIRAIKYQPFLQAWRDDVPAVGLYQPQLLYVTRGEVQGLDSYAINSEVQRLNNVQNWTIRQTRVSQTQ